MILFLILIDFMIKMSLSVRAQRKSRNVPPKRLMDDMMEYFPPVATSDKIEIKDELSGTEDVSPSPTKKRKVVTRTPEKQESAGIVEKYYYTENVFHLKFILPQGFCHFFCMYEN